MFAQLGREARDGDILELRAPAREVIDLARFQTLGVAALVIDYGHAKSAIGDTLQAVRGHLYEHPLTSPGETDLSAHVDFADLGRQIAAVGLTVEPLVTQGAFLAGLGITERASQLMNADPAGANAIEMAVARLLSPSGMGTRFKVLGARSPHLPPLPGWPA